MGKKHTAFLFVILMLSASLSVLFIPSSNSSIAGHDPGEASLEDAFLGFSINADVDLWNQTPLPSIANAAVVSTSNKGNFLIKTRLVITTIDPQRHAFSGDEVIDARCVATILHHISKRLCKERSELIPVDRFFSRCTGVIENEDAFRTYVSRRHKRPANRTARL